MKKLRGLMIFLLVASTFLTASAPAFYRPVRLTIINRTGNPIAVKLFRTEKVYLLKPASGSHLFTVERGKYRVTVWACGTSTRRDVDIQTNFRLTIPRCNTTPRLVEEANMRKMLLYEPQ